MKASTSRDQIEFDELSKLLNKNKVRDIRNYNVGKIEAVVKNGHSVKSLRRKLGIGERKIYAVGENVAGWLCKDVLSAKATKH